MKKIILSAVLVVICIAGISCKRPLAVSVSASAEQSSAIDGVLKDFTKETGIKVVVNSLQGTAPQTISNISGALNSQSSPDFVIFDLVWVPSFASASLLEPLDKYIQSSKFDTSVFFPNVFSSVDTREGVIIALPLTMDAGVVFYRKDAAEAYGLTNLPSSYKEISDYSRNVSKKIKSAGRGALLNNAYYAFQGSITEQTVCNFIEAAVSNGGGISVQNGKFVINTPQNKKALEILSELIKSKVSSTKNYELVKDEYIRAFFQQGGAFAVRGWASDISFHNSSVSLLKGKTAVYDVPSVIKGKSSPVAGGLHMAVAAKSVSKDNASRLALYLASKKVQKKLALSGGITPSRADVYSDAEIISMRPEYAVLPALFSKAVLRPVDPRYPKASEIMQKYISAALYGAYLPADALIKCQAELDQI
ncbi:MAG: hypothetical protein CVV21_08505 [Candidatus Goldiibacteriota bacterium HGW-Goldbacteria-1]|jgi:multiple sugar transport system substrate-binding protein|nr:MAG: hypothetical protein CVV21_08505 [Candidatus Goldiibacteriota bacterium HGW-Goldbacteria-1]